MNDFIKYFAQQFDETDTSQFNADTKFRDFDEWSSLTGLCVLSMIYDKYKVRIKAEEMRKAETIGDIYNLVKQSLPNE